MGKAHLRVRREALENLWQQGLYGSPLLKKHTELIDDHLKDAYANSKANGSSMALLAVGGYGRGELFPFSDIDLLLLYEPEAEEKLDSVTEALFYPLWDAGLDVGHSVRTPEECLSDAEKDFFLLVSLLDIRFLAGSADLYKSLKEKYRKKLIEGRRLDFFNQMKSHREERHRIFGIHGYLLEPNIKECRGGLRDLQSMIWTAGVVFGMKNLSDIEASGLLSRNDRQGIDDSVESIIRIRNRLHYLSGRKNDQLIFEHQEETARALGCVESDGMLGVEHFMREVYADLETIAQASDTFFEHAQESLSRHGALPEDRTISPGIALQAGRMHFTNRNFLRDNPGHIMQMFSHAAQINAPIHYWTKKIIREHLELIDENFQQSPDTAASFFNILLSASDPLPTLTAMLETGLLTAYIPEFAKVESLPQHDVYHIYTVDRHLLQTVSELHFLEEKEPLSLKVKNRKILYLSALIHDIGKGSGMSHSDHGAELAEIIGRRLHLSRKELDLLGFLIRNHLFLNKMSQRRDLEDESFIMDCAGHVKNIQQLIMLYLLTIADARATGPNAWSDWKAALLLELFLRIANVLSHPHPGEPDHSRGADWLREQAAALVNESYSQTIAELPEDYLLLYPPEKIAEHLKLHSSLDRMATIHPAAEDNSWTVTVIARDCAGLLSRICGTLALHGLGIIKASISTWPDGSVVDTFDVKSELGGAFNEQNWEALENDLNNAISGRLGLTHRLAGKNSSLQFIRKKRTGIERSPKVIIDNTISSSFTVFEIFATDHPKLLYDITRTFADFGVTITQARISTAADQIVDAFYTHDGANNKITDKGLQAELREALLFASSNPGAAQ